MIVLEGGEGESISDNAFWVELAGLMGDIKIFSRKDGRVTDITPPKEADSKGAEQAASPNR